MFARILALAFGALRDSLLAGSGVVPDDAVDMIHASFQKISSQ
jgi:hypothetical protein